MTSAVLPTMRVRDVGLCACVCVLRFCTQSRQEVLFRDAVRLELNSERWQATLTFLFYAIATYISIMICETIFSTAGPYPRGEGAGQGAGCSYPPPLRFSDYNFFKFFHIYIYKLCTLAMLPAPPPPPRILIRVRPCTVYHTRAITERVLTVSCTV